MRRIDLSPFDVTAGTPEGGSERRPYRLKESLAELCYHPAKGCTAGELMRRHKIAQRFETTEDEVLIEEAEHEHLMRALDCGDLPLTRNEVEMVRRILEAPVVPVKPA